LNFFISDNMDYLYIRDKISKNDFQIYKNSNTNNPSWISSIFTLIVDNIINTKDTNRKVGNLSLTDIDFKYLPDNYINTLCAEKIIKRENVMNIDRSFEIIKKKDLIIPGIITNMAYYDIIVDRYQMFSQNSLKDKYGNILSIGGVSYAKKESELGAQKFDVKCGKEKKRMSYIKYKMSINDYMLPKKIISYSNNKIIFNILLPIDLVEIK
jgi:hypothetical protein